MGWAGVADNLIRTLAMLTSPLPDLAAWTAWFKAAPIPVLPSSAQAVNAMAANEDAVDAHFIASQVGGDPLMALRLLAHVAAIRQQGRLPADAETVTAALVYLGITPFFAAFIDLPTADSVLAGQPEALAGLHRVLARAHRAARFALGFAVHRADPDAEVLQQAALLHDFAELLLWCHAPTLALEIARRQQADPHLRSALAQRQVLHVELAELEQALMRAWHLPEVLRRMTDSRHASEPQARNVALAIRLARHTSHDWDDPAIPDDITDIAALLNISEAAAYNLVTELDA